MNNFPAMTEEQRQELIADCQEEIAEIGKAMKTWGDAWIPYLKSKLTRQKIALAALTSPPAPVLQLPKIGPDVAGQGLEYRQGVAMGCAWYSAEVQRLNTNPSPPEASNEQ